MPTDKSQMKPHVLNFCLVLAGASACNTNHSQSAPPAAAVSTSSGLASGIPSASENASASTGSNTGSVANAIVTGTGTGTGIGTGIGTGSGIPPVNLTPNCTQADDLWQLAYPQTIEACLAQGFLYDFSTGSCSTLNRSPFVCDYANAKSAIANIGVDTSGIDQQQASGAKLVNCGSTNDGFTVVLQFVAASVGSSCQYTPGTVTTSCFKQLPLGTTPAAQGADCL